MEWGKKFSILQNIQISCGAHLASNSLGTEVLSKDKVVLI
jgi:hypothetical protein